MASLPSALSGQYGIAETDLSAAGPTNESVLASNPPWDSLCRATLISDEQLALIKHYDVKNQMQQDQLLEQQGMRYIELFYNLVMEINKDETLQYVLALIDNMITVDEDRVQLFLDLPGDAYNAFARILDRATAGPFSTAKASKILALLLIKTRGQGPSEVTQQLLSWCTEQLRTGSPSSMSPALSALQILLRRNQYRLAFYRLDALSLLDASTRSQAAQNALQVTYQTIYCLWLLSYNSEIAENFHRTLVIKNVVETIRQVTKVKVIRVGLACLKNLVNKGKNNEQMIDSELMRVLDNLSQRKWGDDDIVNNIEHLSEMLQNNIAELSSFDMYKKEVLSGQLDWTPVHKSAKFWRENVMKFEQNQFELLGVLVNLLRTSENAVVLAVACYDIGEFIRVHPRGRAIVQGLGAKVSIMKLMAHQNEEVKKQALLCVQKLMVVNWEYLAK